MSHVLHEGIVPDGTYRIQVPSEVCDAGVASDYCDALSLTPAPFGDVVEDFSSDPLGPPNGTVNIVDAFAVLIGFSGGASAIIKARADMEPGCIDLVTHITDVLTVIAGFQGLSYPFEPTALDPCDSTCFSLLP